MRLITIGVIHVHVLVTNCKLVYFFCMAKIVLFFQEDKKVRTFSYIL